MKPFWRQINHLKDWYQANSDKARVSEELGLAPICRLVRLFVLDLISVIMPKSRKWTYLKSHSFLQG